MMESFLLGMYIKFIKGVNCKGDQIRYKKWYNEQKYDEIWESKLQNR